MKTNKRRFLAALTASTLALTPCFATGIATLTANASTLTITDSETANHTYKAYQIMTGTKSGSVLSDLQWGTGVNSTALIAALTAKADDLGITATNLTSPETVAKELAKINNDAAKKELLAEIFNESGVLTNTSTSLARTANADTYTANLDDGWYLINDDSALTGDNKVAAKSANILQIVGNTNQVVKHSLPSLTKKITNKNQNTAGDANTASIGDTVSYQITSAVPDMTGYNKYFFVVNDIMEPGLTFNPDSVTVTIGSTDLTNKATASTATTTFEVQTGDAAVANNTNYTFQIVLDDFIQYKAQKDDTITINYTATVNNNATAGNTAELANTNTANLTYSNNPNVDSSGGTAGQPDGPDEPGSTDPKGITTDSTTYTYLTEIKIEKIDAETNAKLGGAKFELTGTSLEAVLHEEGIFKKDASADPAYYLLTDGTYSDTAPTPGTAANYVDGISAEKYALITSTDTNYGSTNKVTASGTSDSSTGLVTFGKLGIGTYKIVETEAPATYNKLTSPLSVTITANPLPTGCTWTYTWDDSSTGATRTVTNAKGSTLPETGGIGTKLFYVFGSLFVVGAATFIVTKRRVGDSK